MQGETVTKNTTYLTGSYIWQKILSFFYFVLIARFIGVEDLGKYTFALSYVTLFAVFVDIGLTQSLIREAAKRKEKAKEFISSVLGMKLIFSGLVYALVVVLVNLMGYPEVTKNLVYVAGIAMIFDQFTASFWGVFRGFQNLKYEAISIAINQVIIVAVGVVVIYLKLPLIYLMLPFICGSLFSLLFAGISVRKALKIDFSVMLSKEVLKFLFKIGIPFALIAIFSRVYGYIDSIMLSKLIGDKAVGWYSVAMKIPFALQFIPAALAAAIFPAFSRYYLHDKKQLKFTFDRVMKFLVIIVVPISIGVALLARPIILFFYGNEYLPSVLPLQILMLGLIFVFLNFPLGSLLNGCDRQVANTVLVGITMVFNVIINIFIIPRYSFTGAAIAFLISHTFLFFISMVVARKIIPYSKFLLLKTIFQSFISVLVMAAVIYYLMAQLHFTILILVGGVVYITTMFITRGLTQKDIKYFIEVLIKKKHA
ncbi:flippase [Candidatus Falkowbacteria bacterium]|jgi:O-antigen/teichoic acid export membrane protein|nr:flippase [Candidatus Falkowbacteria bacterium]MBT5502887.1 flippase [Candidatus Falkowbacteria bacterium]MBT6573749.1 flippase [Candidatus Falkowbacteria bacterium]MBT7349125.1 flippase [Candidatus Falkowbacteria bacterium]MBT7500077.1 flippase [Candidatus Falkowbacteria bacterium]